MQLVCRGESCKFLQRVRGGGARPQTHCSHRSTHYSTCRTSCSRRIKSNHCKWRNVMVEFIQSQ